MQPNERLIVALDVDSKEKAMELAEMLISHVGMFKIGMELFYSCGPEIVKSIRSLGGRIFIDLKLHDIPNTVYRATRVLTRYGANIINVHTAGGMEMMRAASEAASEEAQHQGIDRPLVIAVTVLTSMGQQELNQLGVSGNLNDRVRSWAKMAQNSGLDGVVASALEAPAIRQACGQSFAVITPGIRPTGSYAGDQKRVVTPADAIKAGATYLVVGRPITAAPNPTEVARQVLREMG